VTVECADATTVAVEKFDAVFADPARRRAGGGRVFDPKRTRRRGIRGPAGRGSRAPCSSWSPGIDHALLPPGAEGEWVSVDGDLSRRPSGAGRWPPSSGRATLLPGRRGVWTGTEAGGYDRRDRDISSMTRTRRLSDRT
jgi:hypothetical protein